MRASRADTVEGEEATTFGCISLVKSKKGFGAMNFKDLQFSMECQKPNPKKDYNHKNMRCHAVIKEGQETGNNVIC